MLVTAALILLTLLLAWAGTRLVIRHALRLGLVHAPNQRSFHSETVPHGGGLGLVCAFGIALLLTLATGQVDPGLGYLLLGGGGLLATVGLWDDIRPLRARTRLAIQGLTALTTACLLLPTASPWLWLSGCALATLAMVWWINLYNFMDGIDGLAALECLCLCGSALLLLHASGGAHSGVELTYALLAAAAGGFLLLNWPPARVFMGDVGSIFLGYALALLALVSILEGQLPLLAWLVLGGVFWVDATLTLLRRMLSGEAWHQAHRSHAYQRYAASFCRRYEARGDSPVEARARAHRTTILVVFFLNFLWLLPLAWLVIMMPGWAALWLLVAWAPLVVLVIRSGRHD